MPTPCQKGRCPARADVYDYNTTEYRKGCRRTQCQAAHRLAEHRRKERKAAKAAEQPAAPAADSTPPASEPADADLNLVGLVNSELESLDADHPLRKSLGGIALALAHEIQFLVRAPARSSAPAAKQLVEILERLMPSKKGTLEEELARLLAEDDEDEPATAQQ